MCLAWMKVCNRHVTRTVCISWICLFEHSWRYFGVWSWMSHIFVSAGLLEHYVYAFSQFCNLPKFNWPCSYPKNSLLLLNLNLRHRRIFLLLSPLLLSRWSCAVPLLYFFGFSGDSYITGLRWKYTLPNDCSGVTVGNRWSVPCGP